MYPIILASQSPRRKQLLEWANISFKVIVKPTDESYPSYLSIDEIPIYIAQQKAKDISAEYPGHIIIAADTIVTINNTIIGKPIDRADAIKILQTLSNNTHTVITGVYIKKGNKEYSFIDKTQVCFYNLTLQQIEYYIDTYKPYDKAGAYGIQEWIGIIGVHSIQGDFYNVMGLPISRLVQALEAFY